MMSKEKRRVPKLRFPGFTEDWEQRKLGDLYRRVNERNDGTLGRDKWISVAKMYFQDPDKVQSNNLDTRTYVMKKGDIAFEGHPNNEFKFGRFVLNDIGTGIISELFPIYRPITEYDLDFWKYAIQFERVMAPIFAKSITSSGNSSNKLDHNHFLNQELLVPNIEEQKKIGTLLSILSKNITLHQRKLDYLKLKKKALLQKLFPKNGERYPELRFSGFTGAWEQRKLKHVVELRGRIGFRGYTEKDIISKEQGGILTFSPTNIIDDQITFNCKNTYITKTKYDESPEIKIINGDILFVKTGSTLGKSALVTGLLEDATINPQIVLMRPNEINPEFLANMMINNDIMVQVRRSKIGGAVPTLTETNIKEFNIFIPTEKDESNKIGNIFKNINQLITLHQRKLDHLQLQKKALLQQMFV